MGQQGKIEWLEIAKDGYPPKDDRLNGGIGKLSIGVLVTDKIYVSTNRAMHLNDGSKEWLAGTSVNHPTHWAYINLPK